MNRDRFSGLRDGWARLDGPAGTQMVDTAIEAMADWMRSGAMANHGGAFKHAHETDELVARTRAGGRHAARRRRRGRRVRAELHRADDALRGHRRCATWPGDEIVCTRLDHDSNVRPWLIAAERAGATVRFAEPSRSTLELPASAVEAVLSERTHWVAVTAASNAVGTVPDLPGIVAAARRRRARVHRRRPRHPAPPHDLADARRRRARLLGLQVVRPARRRAVRQPGAARRAPPGQAQARRPDGAPDRWELGTLPFEALAGVRAAAEYMLELDFDAVRAHEEALLETSALDGRRDRPRDALRRRPRPRAHADVHRRRASTPPAVAAALAEREIAVWDGNYAWELERHLGLAPHGGIRAGFLHYNDARDAERLRHGRRVARVAQR